MGEEKRGNETLLDTCKSDDPYLVQGRQTGDLVYVS